MLLLILQKEKLFMKMLKLANGSNSGKLPSLLYSVFLQASIFSKSIKGMEHHRFNGWLTIGIGGIFPDNSRTVQDGVSKV